MESGFCLLNVQEVSSAFERGFCPPPNVEEVSRALEIAF